jgi:hypothetical protein
VTEQVSPYSQIRENNLIVRTFSQDVDEDELVWHRDRRDRQVTVIGDTDWKFQFDDEVPQLLKDVIFIPKNTYHRLIKGTKDLHIQIYEF